jgi:hypothetical protein
LEGFEHAADKGYLTKRLDGTVWQSDIWQAGMGIAATGADSTPTLNLDA